MKFESDFSIFELEPSVSAELSQLAEALTKHGAGPRFVDPGEKKDHYSSELKAIVDRVVEMLRELSIIHLPEFISTRIVLDVEYYIPGLYSDNGANFWHVDKEDVDGARIFIAFGGVANIQCIRGTVHVDFDDPYGSSDQLRILANTTTLALQAGEVECGDIPNGTGLVYKGTAIHQRGPILAKGYRVGFSVEHSKK